MLFYNQFKTLAYHFEILFIIFYPLFIIGEAEITFVSFGNIPANKFLLIVSQKGLKRIAADFLICFGVILSTPVNFLQFTF